MDYEEIIKNLNNELSEYFKKVLKYAYSSNHVFGLKPILFSCYAISRIVLARALKVLLSITCNLPATAIF